LEEDLPVDCSLRALPYAVEQSEQAGAPLAAAGGRNKNNREKTARFQPFPKRLSGFE
jgi:hypothetical protein